MKRVQLLLLAVILLLTLLPRLAGLGWGLPDGTLPSHRSSNRGDENAILQDTLAVPQALRGSKAALMEHSFYMQEGWLGSYVRLGFLGAAYLTGYVRFDDFGNREIGGYDLVNFRRVFLASRLVSVLAGLATVGLIYLIGALHWSKLCGLLAGLVLAIVPGHVVLSHFAKSNALAALLATASLYFALVWQREPSRGAALLAGVFAGLAGGARINAVLSIVGFGLALILRWRALKGASRVSTVMLALVGMLAALAICYPHLIARPSLPDYGVGTIWFAGFNWNVLGQALWLIFGGWPGIVLLLLGLVLSGAQVLGQRDTSCIIVLGWSALYCIFVAKTKVPQPRYLCLSCQPLLS